MDSGRRFTPSAQHVRIAFFCLASILAAMYASASRYGMEPDAVSYLDMGDAFWRGDWRHAVNGLWSPLYGLLLGAVLGIVRPTPSREFTVIHLLGFAIFVCAAFALDAFLRASFFYHSKKIFVSSNGTATGLPEWMWHALGYTVFIWTTVRLIWVPIRLASNVVADEGVLPDMLTAVFVYWALVLVYRIPMQAKKTMPFAALGFVLGVGYLARNFLLPLGVVFLGVAVALSGGLRRVRMPALVAACIFLLVIAPFLVALSLANGRPTMGAGVKLYYAYHVDGVPYVHWQGGPPAGGVPKHPTRKIFASPPAYEFGTPIGGTYPPWYDPAYWYDGIRPRLDLRAQLSVLSRSVREYAATLFQQNTALVVASCALIAFAYLSAADYSLIANVRTRGTLLLLSLAGFAAFAWVHFEPRHLATPIVLLWLGILGLVTIPDSVENIRALASVIIAALIITLIPVGAVALQDMRAIVRGRSLGMDSSGNVDWEVAEGLRRFGVRAGDRVAVLGPGFYAYWARLDRVKIVAEIPDTQQFWASGVQTRDRVMHAVARSGAKLVVTKDVPSGLRESGWARIGMTEYYAYQLRE